MDGRLLGERSRSNVHGEGSERLWTGYVEAVLGDVK